MAFSFWLRHRPRAWVPHPCGLSFLLVARHPVPAFRPGAPSFRGAHLAPKKLVVSEAEPSLFEGARCCFSIKVHVAETSPETSELRGTSPNVVLSILCEERISFLRLSVSCLSPRIFPPAELHSQLLLIVPTIHATRSSGFTIHFRTRRTP